MDDGKSPELRERLNDLISGKLRDIDSSIDQKLTRIMIPYYFVVVLSILFAFTFPFFMSQSANIIYAIVPLIPIGVSTYFRSLSGRARKDLREEVQKTDSSESEITRIIDKYSGIVDGIGTALPLVGAAILLGIVGSGLQGAKFDQYFTGFAVPFEVVSIAVLASAKLFESVFDEMSLNYQEVIDHAKGFEKEYYHEKQIKAIETANQSVTLQLSSSLDTKEHAELRKTYETMKDVIEGLKNENVVKSLQQLSILLSKDK